jgi:D-alanyl-D-alanine carboxypeptidase
VKQYLAARRKTDHISAVSLRVDLPRGKPGIDIVAGTATYSGDVPVQPNAIWQIGSNTKAFTSVMLLQLEAEGKLSVHDTLGKWLPQYPAWRHITINRLLDMTSGIPDYTEQPDFLRAVASAPARTFSEAQLVGYVAHLPVGKASYRYSNTDYILAQMIIERVTHDTYAHQLARRITIYSPIGLFWTYEGGTAGMRVWHVYDPRTGVVIALALNSSAASPDPADNGPDQDTVDQLGFKVYRALERYGAIKPPGQQAARQ